MPNATWLTLNSVERIGWSIAACSILSFYSVFNRSGTWRSQSRQLAASAGLARPRAWAWGALLFALALASRTWASRLRPGWFMGDEILDACVATLNFSKGEGIWGEVSSFLVYWGYFAAYRVLGFAPESARTVTTLSFASSLGILACFAQATFGTRVACFVTASMLLSSAFIVHSIDALLIGHSLLPVALLLLILGAKPTGGRALLAGPVTASGLFIYPAAFITSINLIIAHLLCFSRSWPRRSMQILFVSLSVSLVSSYIIRGNFLGYYSITRWYGGALDLEHPLASIVNGASTILRDLLTEARSANSNNGNQPFLDPAISAFALIGGRLLLCSRLERLYFRISDRDWRWLGVCSMVVAASILMAATAKANPGARRIYSSLPLILLMGGIGFKYLSVAAPRPVVWALAAASIGTIIARSCLVLPWPPAYKPEFLEMAKDQLLQGGYSGRDIVIVDPGNYDVNGAEVVCALELDPALRHSFRSARRIPLSALEQPQENQAGVAVFSDRDLDTALLERAFGAAPSAVRRFQSAAESLDYRRLEAIYEIHARNASVSPTETSSPGQIDAQTGR